MLKYNSVTESVILNIKCNKADLFIEAFKQAEHLIKRQPGYISHNLQQCIEDTQQFLLTIIWETLEDHTQTFRQSADYETWKSLLHHFYDPFPTVFHYRALS